MKAVGIIAEYNPFHNGHKYQAYEARKKSAADVVIAVMSGNFTQRGEPAIVDKWSRAEMALTNGVDLIVELPYRYAVQPADIFAYGGMHILNQLDCEAVSFGIEARNAQSLIDLVDFYDDNRLAIENALQNTSKNTVYAERFTKALEKVGGKDVNTSLWSQPNNQLAIQYMLVNKTLEKPLDISFVHRNKSMHGDFETTNNEIASGTAIRQLMNEEKPFKDFVPKTTYAILDKCQFVTIDDYWPYLRYQLSLHSPDTLKEIYQMSEGLENRLIQKFNMNMTWHEYIEAIKTKRYTYSRLIRLLNYVLLFVKKEEMTKESQISMRILGFNQKGQSYLNHLKNNKQITLTSRLSKENAKEFSTDIKAGRIYRLIDSQNILSQDFQRIPVMV